MDVKKLKEYIIDNEKTGDILESIGCTHVSYHSSSNYYSACNKDGDNPNAVVVYNDEKLTTIDYTRTLVDTNRATDIFDLVSYNLGCNFSRALKHVTDLLGIDYYYDFDKDVPDSVLILRRLHNLCESEEEKEKPLKPISTQVLTYYEPYVNDLFYNDGISYTTQQTFQIGYDPCTNRITIPIYDELGNLVGVKGRLFKKGLDEDDMKYLYLEPTPRSRVLYGLYQNYDYIQDAQCVYVVEAEKGVMQGWSYGYRNCVATGGKKVSKFQIDMLTRLGVKIVFAFDSDVTKDELSELANRFIKGVPIYSIWDKDKLLNDKESPTDERKKWEQLLKNNVYRIK